MNILALSGSLRAASLNSALLRAAIHLAPDEMTITCCTLLGDLPPFNPDRDGEILPETVRQWRAQLQAADGLLICTPEYAHALPGALKNALDWIVATGELDGKPVAALSASPSVTGGAQALDALRRLLAVLGTQTPPEASLAVPAVNKKLAADGLLADAATADALRQVLATLAQIVQDRSTSA